MTPSPDRSSNAVMATFVEEWESGGGDNQTEEKR